MKNLNTLLALVITACSKQGDITLEPPAMAATQLLHYYDEGNKLIKTDTAYHTCKASGAILKSFQDSPLLQHICDTYNILEWRFTETCMQNQIVNP